MLNISFQTKPSDLLGEIVRLREQKGKEKEVSVVIKKALVFGYGLIINLLFEKALNYQHIVMNEDSKVGESNTVARKAALIEMEKTIEEINFYIEKSKLVEWRSRLHRLLGRLYDYKGKFKRAIDEYKLALKYVKHDPEVVDRNIPRQFELEAFLAYSTLQSGNFKKGLEMSKVTYGKFDSTSAGKFLKDKDYVTWAIWKSGIPVRTIKAMVNLNSDFDKKAMLNWLKDAEKDLNLKNANLWADFSYRKEEIKSVKVLLGEN